MGVCLFVLPASLDWLLAGLTSWPGGAMWCQTAVFFDYYLNFLHPLFILMLCIILLRTTRWTQDGKLNRFYKLAIALCVLFIATKSPVEISSFIDLIHTNQLFAIVNKRPDELEREILFIWVALMPVVGNPIIYLFCVSEYRS